MKFYFVDIYEHSEGWTVNYLCEAVLDDNDDASIFYYPLTSYV